MSIDSLAKAVNEFEGGMVLVTDFSSAPKPRDPAESKDAFDVGEVKESLPTVEPTSQGKPKYILPHLRNKS